MAFWETSGFKYLKNFIIGAGAAVVMIGALGKILSAPWGDPMITAGLCTEAFLFFLLGILPPEKDYYWEKLYPGLDKASGSVQPLVGTGIQAAAPVTPLDGGVVEGQLNEMITEMRTMSRSLSSLKALQEVDFSQTGEQIQAMNNFYTRMNESMQEMVNATDDVKTYRANIAELNKNLTALNSLYGNMLNAMTVRSN